MTTTAAEFGSGFLALVVALLSGGLLAGPILRVLISVKARQDIYNLAPETHRKKQGTPTMGGIIILSALIAGILAATGDALICLWLVGFAMIGFADDYLIPKAMKGKRGLGWRQKIVPQAALAIAAPWVFHLPTQTWAVTLCAFLVLFFSNAYNFADGLDGLAGALGLLLGAGFVALAASAGDTTAIPLVAALAGALIPFLFLNAPPAKVFMGDVGSLPIGALFGALAMACLTGSHSSSGQAQVQWHLVVPLVVLSLVMVAELVPVPLQVGFYKLTKRRLFPMTPIHHAFEVKGWPESRVVWSFILVQLVLVLLAIGVAVTPRGLPPAGARIEASR